MLSDLSGIAAPYRDALAFLFSCRPYLHSLFIIYRESCLIFPFNNQKKCTELIVFRNNYWKYCKFASSKYQFLNKMFHVKQWLWRSIKGNNWFWDIINLKRIPWKILLDQHYIMLFHSNYLFLWDGQASWFHQLRILNTNRYLTNSARYLRIFNLDMDNSNKWNHKYLG
jgi:hypothetical protein